MSLVKGLADDLSTDATGSAENSDLHGNPLVPEMVQPVGVPAAPPELRLLHVQALPGTHANGISRPSGLEYVGVMGGQARRSRGCATRAAHIPSAPTTVVDYLVDPQNLPEWAPDFAESVARHAGLWRVSKGTSSRMVLVRSAPELGVVDFVSADDPGLGAFLRVLPDGPGSHVTFTIVFPAGTPERAILGEMEEVDREPEPPLVLAQPDGGV